LDRDTSVGTVKKLSLWLRCRWQKNDNATALAAFAGVQPPGLAVFITINAAKAWLAILPSIYFVGRWRQAGKLLASG